MFLSIENGECLMANDTIVINELKIKPIDIFMYVPPIVWKGDCVGHIGKNDTFFWVLEGECFLNIENEYSIIRPGQLAFLPKGKMRSYTHVSEHFSMYEMAFSAEADEKNLMDILGLCEHSFVVNIPEKETMSKLFENSFRKELYKDPIYDVGWCSNILSIIKYYAEAHRSQSKKNSELFAPVIKYMKDNMKTLIKTEDLCTLVYMQPTYFIRRFKEFFSIPPQSYLAHLRLCKAMELLASTEYSIDKISEEVGISDSSYFARVFKKSCGISPSEYRNAFKH